MDENPLVGTWRLVSLAHYPAAAAPYRPYGSRPAGRLIYTAAGTMLVTLVAEDGSRAFSYGGRYRIEGDRVFNRVEVCSKPAWVGQTQERRFRRDGDAIVFRHENYPTPAGARETAELHWEKI